MTKCEDAIAELSGIWLDTQAKLLQFVTAELTAV